jgi:REP element-mobilizing transposase RayT
LQIARIFGETLRGCDARLLAFAIMPNHLHLVLQQGATPVGRVLQPLLRRVALLVQRSHGVVGHVFERRFRAQPICDAEHLRNAIVYVHLNPVRGGICSVPDEFNASSHCLYAGGPAAEIPWPELSRLIAVDRALPLFASREDATVQAMRGEYVGYVRWRMETDIALANAAPSMLPPAPDTMFGDRHWACHFSAPFRDACRSKHLEMSAGLSPRAPDIRDIALEMLAELAPDLDADQLRSPSRGRRIAAIRRVIISRMIDAGYRGIQIANYLRLDLSCVSRVLAARRLTTHI